MTGSAWQRRQAIQIAAQLPEDAKDALKVLELAQELVIGFLIKEGNYEPRPEPALVVISDVLTAAKR